MNKMKNSNKKLILNKQVISKLNTIVGGYAPTHDCTVNDTEVKITDNCPTKNQNSICICW
jgi:hypothetical protein